MTFKKKLVVTTIAASMAVTAFAGIPLSSKGLAEKVGFVQVASAAFSNKGFIDKVNAIHANLALDKDGQDEVRALRDFIKNDLNLDDHHELIDPIWNKIGVKFSAEEKQQLFDIFKAVLGMTYDPKFEELENLKEEHKQFLLDLADKFGADKLTVNDIVDFAALVESQIKSTLASITDVELAKLLNDTAAQEQLLKKVLVAVKEDKSNKVSLLLQKLDDNSDPDKNVTVDDIIQSLRYVKQTFPEYKPAAKAMLGAYIRTEGVGNVTTNGLSGRVTFKVFGKDITSLLQWESSNSAVTVDNKDDKGKLSTTTSGSTATITAVLAGKVVFEKSVTLSNNSGGYPGGGGGGGISSPADQAVQDLNNKKNAIENATGEAKEALIKEAVEIAIKALNETLKYNASSKVTVADGEAKVSLTKSDLNSLTSGAKKIVAKLKEVAPGAEARLPKLVATIDLGSVSASSVSAELASDLIKELEASGITSFKVTFSGFSAQVPATATFSDKIALNVKKSTAAEDTTSLPVASDVYEFGLTVGGQAVTEFAQPIMISIPLKNAANLDKELLTVAKIVDGKLQFVGGKVQGDAIVESRHSFSSYVVVENKVSFSDISSVQAWAGRQIQVLAAKGVIQGKKEGVFAPADSVTRAEFAKMLVEALDLDSSLAKHNFSDVKAADWFAPYVAAAAESGIINGRTATTFVPNATITRAEMATMVSRALKATAGLKDVEDVQANLTKFTDASDIHSTLASGVALASSKEIVIGSGGKFRPNATANRAEAAVIIYRAFNYAE
ncbi:S-layer homology domain-containing protein [Paenibacillus pinihumi]|uniref:S-layer homology domain-containing protein n=1 Tax=Paenibacillus pinihumi TaxID=669462 RepID=UPI00041638A0|nr:S-layer homology domain-containing protein [Paenibacillus pinihumi]